MYSTKEERLKMKKAGTLLLIFVLILMTAACGSSDKDVNEADQNGNDSSFSEEGSGSDSKDGEQIQLAEYDGAVNKNTDDIHAEDYQAADMESSFDFGFSTSKDFGMSNIVEKLDYSDIESLTSEMESRLNSGIQGSVGGDYEIFSDYEEEDADEIDQLSYAVGLENDDSEGRFFEVGVYHNQNTDKNYQYCTFITENFYSVEAKDIDNSIKALKETMGVTFSKERLTKAIEIAFNNATEKEDYYSLSQKVKLNGNGYTETVKVCVDGFATEENEIGYYISIERERTYE